MSWIERRMIDDGVEGGIKQASPHTQRAAQILCQTVPPLFLLLLLTLPLHVQLTLSLSLPPTITSPLSFSHETNMPFPPSLFIYSSFLNLSIPHHSLSTSPPMADLQSKSRRKITGRPTTTGDQNQAMITSLSPTAPCGACKFLRRKCVNGCIFAPHFRSDQGAARFAAIHKVFGASNVSKLLLHIPVNHRHDAVVTISYQAQARLSDPVYGCVSTILALQQQVFVHLLI